MSRYLPVALGLLTLGCAATAIAAPGDVDASNEVTVSDAALALRIAGGLHKPIAFQVVNGDVASPTGNTGDGKVTMHDALRIARSVAGLDNLGGTPGGTRPLPLYTTLTVSGNMTRDFQLSGGFLLSGNVTHTGDHAPSGISFLPSSMDYRSSGYSSIEEGAYAATLAAGTYNPYVFTSIYEEDETNYLYYDYDFSQPLTGNVTVNADTTKDYARPALPGVTLVTADVSANFEVYGVSYFVQGNGFTGSSTATQDDEGNWVAKVPRGSVQASVDGSIEGDGRSASVEISMMAPFTVGTTPITRTITAPSVVQVTGTITPPAGRTLHSIEFTSVSTTSNHVYGRYDFGGMGGNPTDNNYLMAVPPGRYRVEVNLVATSSSEPAWEYITEWDVAGAARKDLTLPALPPLFTVSGKVTGPDGKPVTGFVSMSTSGTAVNRWQAGQSAFTDTLGQYSMSLPAASYDVVVYNF